MEILVLTLLGLCMGSFVNALVWRIRHKRDMWRERSECTHCHHVLAWYDLLPVISWLLLRGKCRYCRKPIDDSPLVELAVALLFVLSYIYWPYGLAGAGLGLFGLWLAALVILAALTVYDLKWYLLPNVMVFPLIGLGALMAGVRFVGVEGRPPLEALLTAGAGVGVIAGLYGVIYLGSQGKWVGFGDVKLAVFIGLILGWQGALACLLLANLIGCMVVLPGLLLRRLTPKSKIPFGPFLIAGCVIVFIAGGEIIRWYTESIIGI